MSQNNLIYISFIFAAIMILLFHCNFSSQRQSLIKNINTRKTAPKKISTIEDSNFKKTHRSKTLGKKKTTESLTPQEAKQFLAEIKHIFLELTPSSLQPAKIRPLLMELNRRGQAGVKAITMTLSSTPQKPDEVKQRMALVDYLKYRSQWDTETQETIISLVQTPIPENLPIRLQAIHIAEKAELLGGLAGVDWERAAEIIENTERAVLRELYAYEAYHGLQQYGSPEPLALETIQSIVPNFKP